MNVDRGRTADLPGVVPTGTLVKLRVEQLRPSPHNPRRLFDVEPLKSLKASIREHGVLVPLTVYRLPGQVKHAIVDGERRFRCCSDLAKEGIEVEIPANVVDTPNQMASLIYMFNIHQFREQWELMPTALALKSVIEQMGSDDNYELTELTGLSDRQVERCKTILSFSPRYQNMSMESDPKERIPSNFWVELSPVLGLTDQLLPDLVSEEGRDGVIDLLVDKYRRKRIRSVVHFRRILEAYDVHEDNPEEVAAVGDRLREYILDPDLETRQAFDGFILDTRRVQKASDAADKFIREIQGAKIDHTIDGKKELIRKLEGVLIFVEDLLERLEGDDPPSENGS